MNPTIKIISLYYLLVLVVLHKEFMKVTFKFEFRRVRKGQRGGPSPGPYRRRGTDVGRGRFDPFPTTVL